MAAVAGRTRVAVATAVSLMAWFAAMAGPAVQHVAAADPVTDGPTNAATDCILPPGGSMGAINYDIARRPIGTLKGVMLFVDFPDVPAKVSAQTVFEDLFSPDAFDWFSRASYGQLDLQVTPIRHWLRMPEALTAFPTVAGAIQGDVRKRYITEALTLADPEVDFSKYQIVYIITNPEAKAYPRANAAAWVPPTGLTLDGTMIRTVVTFGSDTYNRGYGVLDHETGHIFGLPDYYSEDPGTNIRAYTGSWSVMGDTVQADDEFAWDKWRMGWLTNDQVDCVNGAVDDDYALTPLETDDGTKAVVIRTGLQTAIVAEYRTLNGNDNDICSEGVLIYEINSTIKGTHGPARVSDANPNSTLSADCPYELSDATYGEGDEYTSDDGSVTIDVTSLADDEADLHISTTDAFTAPVRYSRSLAVRTVHNASGTTTFTGTLVASHSYTTCRSGRTVTLQQNQGGAWVSLYSGSTSSLGIRTFTFTAKGTYRLIATDFSSTKYDCLFAYSKSVTIT